MAKFPPSTVARWKVLADTWLAEQNCTRFSITSGVDAWTVARRSGILSEVYADRSVTDGHVQTALEAILPNAQFKDKKVY